MRVVRAALGCVIFAALAGCQSAATPPPKPVTSGPPVTMSLDEAGFCNAASGDLESINRDMNKVTTEKGNQTRLQLDGLSGDALTLLGMAAQPGANAAGPALKTVANDLLAFRAAIYPTVDVVKAVAVATAYANDIRNANILLTQSCVDGSINPANI